MNTFTFTGNLGRDAEVRQAGSSTVCSFSVGVSSGYGDRKQTNWIRCTLWGKRAEGQLPSYLLKGTSVAISGELSVREYEATDGATKASVECNVNALDLIGGKPQGAQQQPSQRPEQRQQAPAADFDSDIPFFRLNNVNLY